MNSIVRHLHRINFVLASCPAINVNQQKCSYYPEYIVKKDRFKATQRKFEKKQSESLSNIREKLNEQFKSNSTFKMSDEEFNENLRLMIYLASNEADLDLLQNCFKKYVKVIGSSNGLLFIRKLISINKIQMAMDLFMNKNNRFDFMKQISSSLALIDALMDNEMYEQVVEVFDKKFLTSEIVPKAVFIPVTLSLLKQNDGIALAKAKKYIDHMRSKNFNISIGSVIHVFFLALQQNDIEYAFNFLAQTKSMHKSIYCNLLIIGLAKLDQVGAALQYTEKLKNIALKDISQYRNVDSTDGKFFKLTLELLKEAVSRSKEEAIKENHDSILAGLEDTRVIETDMIEYFTHFKFGIDKKDYN